MQQLHLVGFTTDQDGLIFSARKGSKSGSYVVRLDKRLLSRIQEAQSRQEEEDDARGRTRVERVESILSPREIQARLRSGRTIAQVAREAGVEEEWVARFAPPILAEQAQVISRARALTFSKQRLGESAETLGASVLWNTAEKGVRLPDDVFDDCWSAFHLREGEWVVRFAYFNRKKVQHAEWEVDLRDGTLTARNRLASELGYVEPGRRRKRLPPAQPPPVAAKPRPPARKTAKKSTAKKSVARKSPAKKSPARKSSAKKSTAKKSVARKSPAKKATTRKAAPRKVAPRKAAARKLPAKKAPARKAPAKKSPAPRRPEPTRATRSEVARTVPERPTPRATPRPTPTVSAVQDHRPEPRPAAVPPRPQPRPVMAEPEPRRPEPEPRRPDPQPEVERLTPQVAATTEAPEVEEPPIRIVSNTPRREGDPSPLTIKAERADESQPPQRGLIRLPGPSRPAGERRRRPLRAR